MLCSSDVACLAVLLWSHNSREDTPCFFSCSPEPFLTLTSALLPFFSLPDDVEFARSTQRTWSVEKGRFIAIKCVQNFKRKIVSPGFFFLSLSLSKGSRARARTRRRNESKQKNINQLSAAPSKVHVASFINRAALKYEPLIECEVYLMLHVVQLSRGTFFNDADISSLFICSTELRICFSFRYT